MATEDAIVLLNDTVTRLARSMADGSFSKQDAEEFAAATEQALSTSTRSLGGVPASEAAPAPATKKKSTRK